MINFYVGQKFGERNVFTAVITAIDGQVIWYTYNYEGLLDRTMKSTITKTSLSSWLQRPDRGCWCDQEREVIVVDTID